MQEEMDYLQHQRLLKDRAMRHKHQLPTTPGAKPALPPVMPGHKKEQLEEFDMMAYMKKQRLAKEREMLEKER